MFSIGIQWQPLPQFTVDTDVKSIHGLYVWTDRTHEHYTVWNMKLTWATTSWFNVFATLNNITATHYQPEFGISDSRFSCYVRFSIGAYYICPPNKMDGKMQNCKVQMRFTL